MKKLLLFVSLLTFNLHAQTIIWSDDFENVASWTLNQLTGTNDVDANKWYINDNEGGVASGGCGVAANGNKTLHVGCQGQWCAGTGAIYNAGDGGLGFIFATTNVRSVYNTNISTVGQTNLTLTFDWIGIGQANADYATVIYSIDGGSTWQNLQAMTGGSNCGSGQGLWQTATITLPASCNNISTLRVGFNWTNNNDGTGSDPSFAVNNVRITTPAVSNPPTALFVMNTSSICQNECVNFSNQSTGSPTSWLWNFGDGFTSNAQNPPAHCFNTPGTYTVSLTATNSGGSNTSTQNITVNPLPNVAVQYTGGVLTSQQTNAIYQWVLCPSNNVIPGATGMSYTPTLNGEYAVIVTTASGCTDTSACFLVQGLSLNEMASLDVHLIPTAFTESFTLNGIANQQAAIALYALDGSEVFAVSNCMEGQLMTPQIGKGVYIAKIRIGDSILSRRVLKM